MSNYYKVLSLEKLVSYCKLSCSCRQNVTKLDKSKSIEEYRTTRTPYSYSIMIYHGQDQGLQQRVYYGDFQHYQLTGLFRHRLLCCSSFNFVTLHANCFAVSSSLICHNFKRKSCKPYSLRTTMCGTSNRCLMRALRLVLSTHIYVQTI